MPHSPCTFLTAPVETLNLYPGKAKEGFTVLSHSYGRIAGRIFLGPFPEVPQRACLRPTPRVSDGMVYLRPGCRDGLSLCPGTGSTANRQGRSRDALGRELRRVGWRVLWLCLARRRHRAHG